MRLPIIPIAVIVVVLGGFAALITSPGPVVLVLDAPTLTPLFELDGLETEVAIAPDGIQYAAIASGDLWLINIDSPQPIRLTESEEAESSPAWSPDGSTITFSRGPDTLAIEIADLSESLFLERATHLTWSDGNRIAFVRDRGLWVSGASDVESSETSDIESSETPEVESNETPDIESNETSDIESSETPEVESSETSDIEPSETSDIEPGVTSVFEPGEASDIQLRELIPADPDPRVSIQSARFSPSGERIIYVISQQGLRGQVWLVDLSGNPPAPLIAEWATENPMAADWVDEQHVVYLTDRSGGLAVWYIDLEANDMLPLTTPLMGRSLAPIGIDVHGERIVVPRHIFDSDIRSSDGTVLAETPQLEYDPAASRSGELVAYTVQDEGRFEIWVVGSDGSDPRYVTLGRHPRFAPNDNELVYSNTDLDGNRDIWKVDIRTGIPVRLTDDAAIDETPDWSPDGRTIIFASELGNETHLWTTPTTGGQRLQWNDGGYAPRFSADGGHVVFWNDGQLWTARADGTETAAVESVDTPTFGMWSNDQVIYVHDGQLNGNIITNSANSADPLGFLLQPVLDQLPDGDWLSAEIEVESTGFWGIDLVFSEEQ
jgi:Tol biopolymer transport system component